MCMKRILGKWTQEYTTKIWEAVGDKYLRSKFSINRNAEMSWKTLYNKMAKAKAFTNRNQDDLMEVVRV